MHGPTPYLVTSIRMTYAVTDASLGNHENKLFQWNYLYL